MDCVGRLFIPIDYKQIFSSQVLKEVIMTAGGTCRGKIFLNILNVKNNKETHRRHD